MIPRILAVAAIGLFLVSPVGRAEEKAAAWPTDYQAALKEAGKSDRAVLVNFTGSDWCGWCLRLAKETFSKPEFAAFAARNLVLLEADFPQGKKQSATVKKQNEELREKFQVEGFPTLVLLDKNGKEIGRHGGYLEGGPAAMVAWIEKSEGKP